MQSWCQQLLWKVIILLEVIFWPRFKHLFKFKFFTEVTPPPPPLLFNPGISEDLVLPSVKKGVFPFTCFGKSFRDTKKRQNLLTLLSETFSHHFKLAQFSFTNCIQTRAQPILDSRTAFAFTNSLFTKEECTQNQKRCHYSVHTLWRAQDRKISTFSYAAALRQ